MGADLMTERQRRDWPGAVLEAERCGVEDIHDTITSPRWVVQYQPEQRPGRGHSMEAIYSSGEHLVIISVDVYGGPSVFVASLDVVHNGSDEECRCEPICLPMWEEEER